MRKLARRVLILTPSSLVEQWRGEMTRQFGLVFITYDDPLFKEQGRVAWPSCDRILASYHAAKREPHRSAIIEQEWDVVIIDEAGTPLPQSQHAALEIRQRAAQEVYPAAHGYAAAEQPRRALQPGNVAAAGFAQHR
jgi:SNF2 family DNA or RNA helicase